MKEIGIVHDASDLRKLIAENPDLPIVVMVGDEAAVEGFSFTYCTSVRARIGEILDCETPFGEGHVYDDRIEFREDVEEYVGETDLFDVHNMEEAVEFDHQVDLFVAKYDAFWKKCIMILADN